MPNKDNGLLKKIFVIVAAGIILGGITFWTQGALRANMNCEGVQDNTEAIAKLKKDVETKFDAILDELKKLNK